MKFSEASNIKLSKALKKGDTIGITAPSSQIRTNNVSAFINHMEDLGFEVVLGETIERITDKDYNSADTESRADDLNRMLRDKSIRAVFAGAGGFGAQRTAAYVDYKAIIADPKPVIGFSDTTFLLNAITQKTGVVTFLGPTGEIANLDIDKKCISMLLGIIMGKAEYPYTYANMDGAIVRRISERGLTGIGRVVGGNLTMVQTSIGTDWEIDTDDKILVLEEVGESSYSIERSLDHLFAAGKFDNVKGVVFGEFTSIGREPIQDVHDSNPGVYEILAKKFGNADFPVLAGYHFSHGDWNMTFPIGSVAKVDSSVRSIAYLDAAVRG